MAVLALSGPKYYQRFHEVVTEMVTKYGVNQFKFDGTGNADRVVKGSEFSSDFDAAIHLIGDLRRLKPELFINLTTGDLSFAVLALLRRLDLARRGRHRLRRRGH